jgi:D-glycero-alpha-D-manno-heptose-7-phosphate kinase
VIYARAPLRISFAGGGTDVEPYPKLHGGAVLSAAIDLHAYACVQPRAEGTGEVHSPDLDAAAALSGRRQLAHSVLARSAGHADVVLHCDAPPGSGLGSSSSLVVALCAATAEQNGTSLAPYELAERAIQIERGDLAIPGGTQDQYAAAFGGFNFIEFEADGVLVNPLRVRPEILAELQGSLVVLPTATVQRRSEGILRRQIEAYEREDADVLEALALLKEHARAAKACVLRGDLGAFAEILHDGWITKRKLAEGISTPEIDELYDDARSLGAIGGKLLGAGGGGYLLLLVPFERRGDVVHQLRRRGLQPGGVSFTEHGAQAWRARG